MAVGPAVAALGGSSDGGVCCDLPSNNVLLQDVGGWIFTAGAAFSLRCTESESLLSRQLSFCVVWLLLE
jgi:hypothetical protein